MLSAEMCSTATATNADPLDGTVGRRTISQEGYLRAAGGDVPPGVSRVELVARTADGGHVDDVRLEAKVFGDVEPGHTAAFPGVVKGVNVRQRQSGICQRGGGAAGFNLQRTQSTFDVA